MLTTSAHARHHLTSDQVYQLITQNLPLDAAGALAVASWWQAPGGHGLVFAQFVSGYPVEVTDLLAAIDSERPEARKQHCEVELVALSWYVHTHMRETP